MISLRPAVLQLRHACKDSSTELCAVGEYLWPHPTPVARTISLLLATAIMKYSWVSEGAAAGTLYEVLRSSCCIS